MHLRESFVPEPQKSQREALSRQEFVARGRACVRHSEGSFKHAKVGADPLAGPWSVTMTEPFRSIAVYAHSGHLLIDLKFAKGCVRMQLMRRDLPAALKTFIGAVGQLASLAE